MNRQHIVKSIGTSFPTEWHNATKFGINQILMAITLASISGKKQDLQNLSLYRGRVGQSVTEAG